MKVSVIKEVAWLVRRILEAEDLVEDDLEEVEDDLEEVEEPWGSRKQGESCCSERSGVRSVWV